MGWLSGLLAALPAINTPLVKLDSKTVLAVVDLAKNKGWLPATVDVPEDAIEVARGYLLEIDYKGSLKDLVTRDWRYLAANALGLVSEGKSAQALPAESLAYCSHCGSANFGFLDNGFVCKTCGVVNA